MKHLAPILASLLFWLTSSATVVAADLVLANGRVMDPATKLDAVRHIGITGGRITAISATPLE